MTETIQYISQGASPDDHLDNIKSALDAGVKWVQLRMKNYHEDVVYKTALQAREITLKYDAKFILNDYYNLVYHCDADGVHLGKNDENPEVVRHILGSEYIIGATANTLHDIMGLLRSDIDYIGLGPFQDTKTKDNLSPILGLDGYRKIMGVLNETSVDIPVFAIGGIEDKDVDAIIETGVHGVAISGFLSKGDVAERYKKIKEKING